MLEIIPLLNIKEEEPENESTETVITIDDDISEIEFIKEEPLIDSCLVPKVKAENTPLDIADIWPSSEEKEREETAQIIQKIIALSCKKEQDDEVIVVSEVFKGWDQEFRTVEKSDNCNRIPYIVDGFRGWSEKPDLSEKFKEWYNLQLKTQGLNEGVADTTSCSGSTHLKVQEDVIGSNSLQTNIVNYVCCKCKGISGGDVNVVSSNSGENQFKCNVCMYVCSSSEDLKTHMSVHGQNIGPAKLIEKDTSTKNSQQVGRLKKKIINNKSSSSSVHLKFKKSSGKETGSVKKITKLDNTTSLLSKISLEKLDKKLKLNPVVVLDVIADNVLKNNNYTFENKKIYRTNKLCETGKVISGSVQISKNNSTEESVGDQQYHKKKLNEISVDGNNASKLEHDSRSKNKTFKNSDKVGIKRKLSDESTRVMYVNGKCSIEEYKKQKLARSSLNKYKCKECCFKSASQICVEDHMKIHLPKKYKDKSNKSSRSQPEEVDEKFVVPKESDTSPVNPDVVQTMGTLLPCTKTKEHYESDKQKLFDVLETSDSSPNVLPENQIVKDVLETSDSSPNVLPENQIVKDVLETSDSSPNVLPENQIVKDVIETSDSSPNVLPENQIVKDVLKTSDSSPPTVLPENQIIKSKSVKQIHKKRFENYKISKLSKKKDLHKCLLCNFKSTHEKLIQHAQVHNYEQNKTEKVLAKVKSPNHKGIIKKFKKYKCTDCDYASTSFHNLTLHKYRHSGEKPFNCKLCSYKCRRPQYILLHMRMHNGEKPYKCSICNDRFSQASSLTGHMRIHTGDKPYKCDYCHYTCSRISNLKYHLDTHSEIKPFKCNLCHYECSRSYSLKIHLRCHTGERPYKCTTCNYSAKNSSGLKMHMYMHSNYKPLKCKMCSYATANSVTLEMHIRTHTGEKPYQCSVCDYRTSRPPSLKMHERIHSGEKPYVCSICQFSCARHGNLVAHMRSHTGERPYECGSCSTRFSSKSALTIHTRIHTGERPYKCKFCSYASYASAELKKHVKRRHEKHLSDNNNS